MADTDFRNGVLYAVCAYLMWGFAPLYFKALGDIPPAEVLMHRVVWSFFLIGIIVAVHGRLGEVRALLVQPKMLLVLTISALVVGANWLLFIWAVANDYMLDASLGYYINPLLNVVLGMLIFGERLGRLQGLAVVIAALGVLVQLIQFGSLPWISLILASSFALYGALRKKINIKAGTGLLIETTILLPLAVGYWLFLDSPTANFANNSLSLNLLLMAAGVVTTLPLLTFASAAIRIPFYLLGMLQYIGPSIMFLLAVLVFDEQLNQAQIWTFAFIWAALMLLSIDGIKKARHSRRARKATA